MKSIGFKNFRKFSNFKEMRLYPITFLVGTNNSGKSTIIKAIESINKFVNITDNQNYFSKELFKRKHFYFNRNVGTFKRAVFDNNNSKTIVFYCKDDNNNDLEIDIKSAIHNEIEEPYGLISKVNYYNNEFKIQIQADFQKDNAIIIFNHDSNNVIVNVNEFEHLKRKDKYFQLFNQTLKVEINGIYHNNNHEDFSMINSESSLIEDLLYELESKIDYLVENSNYQNPQHKELCWFINSCKEFIGRNIMGGFEFPFKKDFMQDEFISYYHINNIPRDGILNTKTLSPSYVRTLREFQYNVKSEQRDYIKKWLSNFQIGKDLSVKIIEQDIFILYIIDKDGDKIKFSEIGTGSVQIILLLIELASLIDNTNEFDMKKNQTIIIEEPEQNLHPKLQSKLTELFYETFESYNIKFIIETHSEYLIRKSQSIVKRLNFKNQLDINNNNPFGIYYVDGDNDKTPYYMLNYRTDGNFSNEFGSGFYDESTKLLYEIL